ncbi:hypothetical protein RRG08_016507 [Elysia crispata]|uniref:Uncharacterized protein n=1 Tax=Elysia crispata TaxID=231223 RepID=A0AAE0Y8Y0_9GAST|nr:hypothetical protein RRG08_016507 [Elysia crispata]
MRLAALVNSRQPDMSDSVETRSGYSASGRGRHLDLFQVNDLTQVTSGTDFPEIEQQNQSRAALTGDCYSPLATRHSPLATRHSSVVGVTDRGGGYCVDSTLDHVQHV